jgi:ubiquinone/menaquinone biosynthesis C-methylase UbiE
MSDKGFNRYDWIDDTKYPEKLFHQIREWDTVRAIKRYPYESVLDAGCGTGLITRHLKNAIGIDVNPWALERAKIHAPNAKYFVASIDDLPFKDNNFDMVVCTHTMEHVVNPHKALNEFFRILKDNGVLIGAIPSNSIIWKYRKYLTHSDISEEPFHVNYNYGKLKELLKNYNYKIRPTAFGMEWQFICTKRKE